jgi:predicted component of type VI protein secretion system
MNAAVLPATIATMNGHTLEYGLPAWKGHHTLEIIHSYSLLRKINKVITKED